MKFIDIPNFRVVVFHDSKCNIDEKSSISHFRLKESEVKRILYQIDMDNSYIQSIEIIIRCSPEIKEKSIL